MHAFSKCCHRVWGTWAPLNVLLGNWTPALLFWPRATSERTQEQQIQRTSSSILKSGTVPDLQEMLHCPLLRSTRWQVKAHKACTLLSLQFYNLNPLQSSSTYFVYLPEFVCIAAFLPFLLREQPSFPHLPEQCLAGKCLLMHSGELLLPLHGKECWLHVEIDSGYISPFPSSSKLL